MSFGSGVSSRNDPALVALIAAPDEEARDSAIAKLATRGRRVAERVLAQSRSGSLPPEDRADIVSTVVLRLVRRLSEPADWDDAAIGSFDDFVATLTYHALYDVLRRRYPERTRLKNRLRYLLTRDDRFALWNGHAGTMAGLAKWRGSAVATSPMLSRETAPRAALDADSPEALAAILAQARGPLLFDDLVDVAAELWNVREAVLPTTPAVAVTESDPTLQLEQRQVLERLWLEVTELRLPQRRALLLNLRDSDGSNAVALLVLVGTATFDQIAAAIDFAPERLAEIWAELPMNDLRIAELLGMTRQRVINLRKAARERLARRMERTREGSER